jgi:UDP-N-acetyl-D-galactosamine dehydrogenase
MNLNNNRIAVIGLGAIDDQNPVDSLIVAVGHAEFRAMKPGAFKALCRSERQPILGDLKSLFDRLACSEMAFTVFRL